MNASVPVADVAVIILALVVMTTPWLPSKGRFIASVASALILWGLIALCDNAIWIHWIEFMRTYWYAMLLPILVFIIGIFASKSR